MTFLANGGNALQAINNNFAEGNRGFQAGTITGHVNAEFHHYAPERPETPPTPLSTILPFDRDPDYVERGSLLEDIGAKLSRAPARVALVGLGGVGKTQLAIEYAHQLRLQSPETWLLWLYASNEARFEQSVRGVLDQLRVRGRKDPKANVFQLLRNRLCDATKGPWLVILDNADDVRVLLGSPSVNDQVDRSVADALPTEARLDYIPKCGHGKVLVTSRSKEAAEELVYSRDVIAVEPMKEEQALQLLRKKLDTWYTEQHALRLAQELDYMPLALAQAAAYICQRDGRCSIEQYLDKIGEYDKPGTSILDVEERDPRRDRGASNSIMLTWQISFNHICEVRRSAADLLSLMSFFDRQAIPEALLQGRGSGQAEDGGEIPAMDSEDSERGGEDAGTGRSSEHNAEDPANKAEEHEKDIVVLRDYSLISLTSDRTVFEMHRLVQVATKKWLRAAKDFDRWASQFISNLEQAFPSSDIGNWDVCQSLLPHTMGVFDIQVADPMSSLQQASLLLRSGEYALEVGVYNDAERMAKRSLEARRDVLGEGHPDTLTSMGNLASTYLRQGRWEEAEKLGVEVLQKRKEVLGAGHPSTLMSMGNLASTYSEQGRWEEAEKVQVEVVEKRKEVLGEGHPSTLRSMGNLAITYSRQGRWEEAEKLEVEVVEKMKEVLGKGHPDTLMSMDNLAGTYMQQGWWKEAEKVQVEVLAKTKEVLGEGHPSTLRSMGNLASTYSRQGRWEEAEKLEVEVVEKMKEVLGEGHPSTLTSMGNLASTYSRQGWWEEAEKLEVEVVEKMKEVLGEGHPDTLMSMGNLASTYSEQGRWEEAEELEVEVVEKRKEVLGEGHPSTLRSMGNLASTYSRQGWWEEAEKLEVEVVEKMKEVLGEGHPSTLTSMGNLASTYMLQGRWEEAEKLGVEVLQKRKEVLGAGHPSTLTSMSNLAITYSNQGRWNEAEKLQVEVMEKSKEALGEGHPSTLTSISNLAFTLRALGRYQSSSDLISLCAEISQATLGTDNLDTIAFFSHKARWEADDPDDTPVGMSGDQDREVGGEEGASTGVVDSPGHARLDSMDSNNTWIQPQFLWLM
ncbi:hypothetical protein Q7P36_010989 [Cladosporium allicinum]